MKGICKISTMACRNEPSDRSEMVNQLLFGESFSVLEEKERWLRIKGSIDNYESWIPREQFTEYQVESHPAYSILNTSAQLTTTSPQSSSIQLSPGSRLTLQESENIEIIGQSEMESALWLLGKEKILPLAYTFLNSPYLWGGRSIWGIDCSGFIQVLFICTGMTLPRDASEQAQSGKRVAYMERKPLDLAFFSNPKGRIVHVGLVVDPHTIIHASGKVRIDKLSEEGIIQAETNRLTHTFSHIQRIPLKP